MDDEGLLEIGKANVAEKTKFNTSTVKRSTINTFGFVQKALRFDGQHSLNKALAINEIP